MICKNCKKETEQITNLDLINGNLCPNCYNLLDNKEEIENEEIKSKIK